MLLDDERGVKLLLASIIRRAAYDIALYKNDSRLNFRLIAKHAYDWMFEDITPDCRLDRFTAFLNICEVLGISPEKIRRDTLKMQRTDVSRIDRGKL